MPSRSIGIPTGKPAPIPSLSWRGQQDSVSTTGSSLSLTRCSSLRRAWTIWSRNGPTNDCCTQGWRRGAWIPRDASSSPLGSAKTLKSVCGSCQVCQLVEPPNQLQAGKADWTPVPDIPVESVAIHKFAMPPVGHGKEIYHCVILCMHRHSRHLVALPARDKGLTAEAVARQMISH